MPVDDRSVQIPLTPCTVLASPGTTTGGLEPRGEPDAGCCSGRWHQPSTGALAESLRTPRDAGYGGTRTAVAQGARADDPRLVSSTVGRRTSPTTLTSLMPSRRHLTSAVGAVAVLTLLVLVFAAGTSAVEPALRVGCMTFLAALPLLSVFPLGYRGAALTSALSVPSALVIEASLPGDAVAPFCVALAVVVLVSAPMVVVALLLKQLHRADVSACRAANTDESSGLLNRRGLLAEIPALLRAATARGEQVVLTLVDLGDGEHVEEFCSRDAAAAVRASAGPRDLLVRYSDQRIGWVSRHTDVHLDVEALRAERGQAVLAALSEASAVRGGPAAPAVRLGVAVRRAGAEPSGSGGGNTAVVIGLLASAEASSRRVADPG